MSRLINNCYTKIIVRLLTGRPSANNYFNSTVLQEWTRATNVRIRLLRTKNLLGHLMSVARQDPTVTRRYFYSIKDISIGGRCVCNGHASTCSLLDPRAQTRLLACSCQHNTCGIQCEQCCPGFEQKKWRQNTNAWPFQCERNDWVSPKIHWFKFFNHSLQLPRTLGLMWIFRGYWFERRIAWHSWTLWRWRCLPRLSPQHKGNQLQPVQG